MPAPQAGKLARPHETAQLTLLSEHLCEVLGRGEGDPEDLPHLRPSAPPPGPAAPHSCSGLLRSGVVGRVLGGVVHALLIGGQDHDVAVRLGALGLGDQSGGSDDVVAHLALEGDSSGSRLTVSPEVSTLVTASWATLVSSVRRSAR